MMNSIFVKLWELLFSEDKKRHPMPPKRAAELEKTIQSQLPKKEGKP